MALRKARRLTCKDTPIYLRAWHNSRTCKCMTTALLWRIENTRGIWNIKGLSEHTRQFCLHASRKLGRVYFENCPLSLSQRVTTNSFPHEFQSSQSCRVDAHWRHHIRTYVRRRGVDFKFPWRSTARQHGSFVTRTGKEMRNVEKKGNGLCIVFFKYYWFLKRQRESTTIMRRLRASKCWY